MSELSFMENLLDEFDVEWKALGDVAEYSQTRVDASCLNASTFVGVDNLVADKGGRVDATYMPNTERLTAYEEGDILLGNIRPYLKKVWKATNSGGCSGDVLAVRISENFKKIVSSDYLYYLLSSDEFFSYNMQHAKGAKMPRGNKLAILNYQIPIPCPNNPKKSLEIQAEIVRILDAFTAMTAELTAELTAEVKLRKKQYNYYRDRLLSFDEGEVEWKTLGEVTQLITKGTTPKEFVRDGVNFIKLESFDNNQIKPEKFMFITPEVHNKELKRSVLQENDILFAIAGATIGKCAIVDKSVLPANTNQALAIVRLGLQVNVRFVFYYMQTRAMTDYIAKFNKTSAQPNINLKQMSDFKIPVPSLNEQIRIVNILDTFNTLTTSIQQGLPREIELRQKQYEYYRDLLLSFPKPDAEVAA